MNHEVSLEEARGYASYTITIDLMILWLGSISHLLDQFDTEGFPFDNFEDLVAELTVHECIHKMFPTINEKLVDGWHVVLCRRMSGLTCDCPISCFWRHQMED